MKFSLMLLLAALCTAGAEELVQQNPDSSVASADQRAALIGKNLGRFQANSGKSYRDVTITKINDAGISFSHADGAARLRFEDLSQEQRQQFGITKSKAESIYEKEKAVRIAYERRVAAQEQLRNVVREKEAEARQLEAEVAAAERKLAAVEFKSFDTNIIPSLPTVRRINIGNRVYDNRFYSRAYRYSGPYGYPYGYRFRASTSSHLHSQTGFGYGSRTPSLSIRW